MIKVIKPSKIIHMDKSINTILSEELFESLKDNSVTVLYATAGTPITFNSTLLQQLKQFSKDPISTICLLLDTVDYTNIHVQKLISSDMQNIGLPENQTLLPGYYLFKENNLVAYHPGTFDVSRLNKELQNTLSLTYGIIAITTAIFTKSFSNGLIALAHGAESSTGYNIYQFFQDVLNETKNINIWKRQADLFQTELSKAYTVLDVSPLSSDEQIKKAWKEKLKIYHPDKSMTDKETRTKMTVQINAAYELINATRTNSKKMGKAS